MRNFFLISFLIVVVISVIIVIKLNTKISTSEIEQMQLKSNNILITNKIFKTSENTNNNYFFSLPEKKALILSCTEIGICHACSPTLSLFVYKKINGNWNLKEKYLAFSDSIGANGEIAKEDIKIFPINSDSFLIIIKVEDMHFGIFNKDIFCFLKEGETLKYAGEINLDYDNTGSGDIEDAGALEWESKYSIIKNPGATPKIQIDKTGINKDDNFHTIETYDYNGKEYVLTK